MKLSPPFKELSINAACDIVLFSKPEPKPDCGIFPEDLQDLWNSGPAKAEYAYIGYLKVKNRLFPFCMDLTDENLPVYSIDANWSEQILCLLYPNLKGFYAFMRQTEQNKNDLKTKLPDLLQGFPLSVEYPEFWQRLIR